MEKDQSKPTPDFLDEQDAINRINAYSKDDWKELLSLIPEIENIKMFGELHWFLNS